MAHGESRYQIRVRGHLDDTWSDRLGGMTIEHPGTDGQDTTTLTGVLSDQSALSGVVSALVDLQYEVLSVDRIE